MLVISNWPCTMPPSDFEITNIQLLPDIVLSLVQLLNTNFQFLTDYSWYLIVYSCFD